jgi:hypothetical protein
MRVIIQNRKFNSMEHINVNGSKYDIGFDEKREWRREGGLAGAGAPARKCPSLVNIYNFNKNN